MTLNYEDKFIYYFFFYFKKYKLAVMNSIVNSSIATVSKSKWILDQLTNEQLTNTNIPPYYSCVGTHIRHILDFYKCIFNGLENKLVDLTDRSRETQVERDCDYALSHVNTVIEELAKMTDLDPRPSIKVIDDLGQGKMEIEYTLGALLAQANSHTIHHYAIISYLLENLGIAINDDTFGYNPTTPITNISSN